MHRILLAAAALAVSTAGAMAQMNPAPVPNASGSQTTDPASHGSTASEWLNRTDTGVNSTGSINSMPGQSSMPTAPVPKASGSQVTNPAGEGSTASQQLQR